MSNSKYVLVTARGCEDILANEIEHLLNRKMEYQKFHSFIILECSQKDAMIINYKSQTLYRMIEWWGESTEKNIESDIQKMGCQNHISDDKTVAIRIAHDLSESTDLDEQDLAKEILAGTNVKVNLKNPEMLIIVYTNGEQCVVGRDVSGFDLSKRDYKVFNTSYSLKPTIAAALVVVAKPTKEMVVVDPFCISAEIAIEMCYYLNNASVRFYEKEKMKLGSEDELKTLDNDLNKVNIHAYDPVMKHVLAGRKNVKIAGQNKLFTLTRVHTNDLDLKWDDNSVDRIVTRLPEAKMGPIVKLIEEFWSQSSAILKKDGKIVVLVSRPEQYETFLDENKLGIESKLDIWQGQESKTILVVKKK